MLINEQGFVGGAPLTGPDSGAAQNYDAVVDQPYQIDFYDGGGLDLAFLSAAEVDPAGNVKVSRFGSKIVGIGGFVNTSQNARKVVFSGTFTAGGLQVSCEDGRLRIANEGRHGKFVGSIEQICYNASFAERDGRQALFVTERYVFRAAKGTLELIEVAPGIDSRRDVLDHTAFQPTVSDALDQMDARLFAPPPVGLRADLERLPRQARSPRRQASPA